MYAEISFLKLKKELGVRAVLSLDCVGRKEGVDGWWAPRRIKIGLSRKCLNNPLVVNDIDLTILHELSHQVLYESRTKLKRKQDFKQYIDDKDYRKAEEIRTWRVVIKYAKKLGYWDTNFKTVMKRTQFGRIALKKYNK